MSHEYDNSVMTLDDGGAAGGGAGLSHRSWTWPVIGAGQCGLTAMQRDTLSSLVRWPFISVQDLCLALDGPALSTVYGALADLAAHCLVEWVPYVSSRAQHERLWYLADQGVRLAAHLVGEDPASFAHRWGLGETALVRRLGRLEHLTLSRGFLLDLHAAFRARQAAGVPGPVMTSCQPWPVRLTYTHRSRRCVWTLDGTGTLVWGVARGEVRHAAIGLLWDDGGGLALDLLRPNLVAALRAHAARERMALLTGAGPPMTVLTRDCPTVLLVAARLERAQAAWSLAHDVARTERVAPPDLLVTSTLALRVSGPVDTPWRDMAGREDSLAALLTPRARPVVGGMHFASNHSRPDSSSTGTLLARPARLDDVLVRGHFSQRAMNVHAALEGRRERQQELEPSAVSTTAPEIAVAVDGEYLREGRRQLSPTRRALLALQVRPSERRLLRCLGLVPLATQATLTTLTSDRLVPAGAATRGWATPHGLARLVRWGLCDYHVPARSGIRARRRYFLTPSGLALLATLAGLSPAAYCRLTGAIAGTRLPVPLPTGRYRGHSRRVASGAVTRTAPGEPATHAPCRPGPSAHRVTLEGNRLAYYQRYADHTAAVQDIFVRFVCAARAAVAQGADHALEAWQGEWAALRRYPHDGGWHTLRPDAYGRYRAGTTTVTFFLEVDRGTSGLRAVEDKLAAYCAYRDSGLHAREPTPTGLSFPVVLIVTTSEERLHNIVALARSVAADRMTLPLMVWGATVSGLAAHGPLGRIWRNSEQHPPHWLWPTVDGGSRGAGG